MTGSKVIFQKIKPKKVSEEIYEQLKNLILKGELKPGERLPAERELAVQVGVSRPTLREALHKLEAHGFLKQIQGDGTYVLSAASPVLSKAFSDMISRDGALSDLMELRKVLETWAAKAAAERADDKEIEQLGEFIKEMESSERDYDTDANFHALISYASHNVLIIHVMNLIHEWIAESTVRLRRHLRKGEGTAKIDRMHREVYEAIKNRCPDRAHGAMLEHMEYLEGVMKEIQAKKST